MRARAPAPPQHSSQVTARSVDWRRPEITALLILRLGLGLSLLGPEPVHGHARVAVAESAAGLDSSADWPCFRGWTSPCANCWTDGPPPPPALPPAPGLFPCVGSIACCCCCCWCCCTHRHLRHDLLLLLVLLVLLLQLKRGQLLLRSKLHLMRRHLRPVLTRLRSLLLHVIDQRGDMLILHPVDLLPSFSR